MTDLAKEIIKLGQIKDYERLEAIITKCDTKEVRNLRHCLNQPQTSSIHIFSVKKNCGRKSGPSRCYCFLELFINWIQMQF